MDRDAKGQVVEGHESRGTECLRDREYKVKGSERKKGKRTQKVRDRRVKWYRG